MTTAGSVEEGRALVLGSDLARRAAIVVLTVGMSSACAGQDAAVGTAPTTAAVGMSAPSRTETTGPAAISPTRDQTPTGPSGPAPAMIVEFEVPAGSHPHDVAPAPDGTVWYTAQRAGALGRLDPSTGAITEIPLGAGSAPHGVIIGPDGAAWVTDGGLDAIVRVDPATGAVSRFPLPTGSGRANLNTAVFDDRGVLWFTGQSGVYGSLDPVSGVIEAFESPRGPGPYGIAVTPGGEVYFASLAGSYLGHVEREKGTVDVLEPPTGGQGARRVWSDSRGRLWISEWNAGQLAMFDPAVGAWREWRLPGDAPSPYAVFVDEDDQVWLSDFGSNAILRFDPSSERFDVFPIPSPDASVRQLLGRPGEIWGAESRTDKLILVKP